MTNVILLLVGAALPVVWGTAHVFPTRSVVRGFGPISADNARIITMEWILEGVALIFVGAFVATATMIDHASPVSQGVHVVAALALAAFAVVSVFTWYRVNFLPYRLCPFIFGGSAVLILAGAFV